MTEAITRLFFALNVQHLNIILFLISIRLFKSHIIFEGVSWLHPGPLGERMVHVDLRLLLQGLRGTLEPRERS